MPQRNRRLLHAGLALLALATATAAAPAAPAAAAPPPRADLVLHLTSTQALNRGSDALVHLTATVDNVGVAGVDDITIRVHAPAGSSIVGDPSWQCDYTTFICTNIYGAVPAGGSAEPLNMYLKLPAGADGATATIAATVSTSAREASDDNNSDRVTVTYQSMPDLSLLADPYTDTWGETSISTTGGNVLTPGFTVRNTGTGTADNVRLLVDLPAGVTSNGYTSSGASWECDFSVRPAACTTPSIADGAETSISFSFLAPPGTDGDALSLHFEVTTSTPQWQIDDTTATVTYRYVAPVA